MADARLLLGLGWVHGAHAMQDKAVVHGFDAHLFSEIERMARLVGERLALEDDDDASMDDEALAEITARQSAPEDKNARDEFYITMVL